MDRKRNGQTDADTGEELHRRLGRIGASFAHIMRRLIIALFAQCCAASRRILLLHGSSSSAGAFLNRGALNVLGAAATAYHDGGPHAWQFGGVEWDADINEATDYGAFWSQTLKTPQSLAAGDLAVALVEDELRAGGYQGVIGFSQGAMLASVAWARSRATARAGLSPCWG